MGSSQPSLSLLINAKPDPSQTIVYCELAECSKPVTIGDSYSFAPAIMTTGPTHIGAFQCPHLQHFGCCMEHALIALFLCLREHVVPLHAEREHAAIEALNAQLQIAQPRQAQIEPTASHQLAPPRKTRRKARSDKQCN